MSTYRIPEQNLETLKSKIENLGKKASKLNLELPVMIVGSYEDTTDGYGIVTRLYEVTVTGEAPKINGWKVIAKLEHGDDGKNIIKSLVSEDLPEMYRTSTNYCDHCGTNRQRNVTYIITKDNETKQVGSSCLKDFTGHENPQALAEYAELLNETFEDAKELEDPLFGGGESEPHYLDTAIFLGWIAAETHRNGYTSRKQAEGNYKLATVDAVLIELSKKHDREKPCQEDYEAGRLALEWIRQYLNDKPRLNDFEHNLSIITDGKSFKAHLAGYVAAIYPMWLRAKEDESKEIETGEYIGEVGKRIDVSLTLVSIKHIDGRFGTTILYRFHDADNNVVVWFSSTNQYFTVGQTYTGKATVKERKEYGGTKQTVITRAKLS